MSLKHTPPWARRTLPCHDCGRRTQRLACPICLERRCDRCAEKMGGGGCDCGSDAPEDTAERVKILGAPRVNVHGSSAELGGGTMAKKHGVEDE